MSSFGIDDDILEKIIGVLSGYSEIEKTVIYGSRAVGTFKPGSDIDMAVYAPLMTDRKFKSLCFDLDALPIIFKMDVVHRDSLQKSSLCKKIDQEGKSIYQKV